MKNYATGTRAEFIIRELHSIVDDPGLYNWEEIWDFLRELDVILYDHESQTYRWNDASHYRQTPGVLYDLIDSYALDCIVTHKRYVEGEIWTQRIRANAANGLVRGITYSPLSPRRFLPDSIRGETRKGRNPRLKRSR